MLATRARTKATIAMYQPIEPPHETVTPEVGDDEPKKPGLSTPKLLEAKLLIAPGQAAKK